MCKHTRLHCGTPAFFIMWASAVVRFTCWDIGLLACRDIELVPIDHIDTALSFLGRGLCLDRARHFSRHFRVLAQCECVVFHVMHLALAILLKIRSPWQLGCKHLWQSLAAFCPSRPTAYLSRCDCVACWRCSKRAASRHDVFASRHYVFASRHCAVASRHCVRV